MSKRKYSNLKKATRTRWRKKTEFIISRLDDDHTSPTETLPEDPVRFCREWLRYNPFPYMIPFLRDQSHFIANLQARQTGKTFNGMAKILHLALTYPNSTIIITAPKLDQVKNIAFKHLHDHLRRMKRAYPDLHKSVVQEKGLLKTIIRFENGSQILAEAPVPGTIRGHTAKAVYLMECNFIRDDEDLYTAILFTLNTTDGYLIVESTPWNTDSVFYKIFHSPEYEQFSKYTIPYTEALPPNGPLTPTIVQMIQEQLRNDPNRWRREMLCQWTEDSDRWLPMSLITLCQDANLTYYKAESKHQGVFHAGVDFGKKQSHSVVAIIEEQENHLYLRHCHQLKLDTPYGVVIGYLKRLQDKWTRFHNITCDHTGVGEYIVEDMKKSAIRNVQGVIFTETLKETIATALKETMRTAECPLCHWKGQLENTEGELITTCPNNCMSEEGNIRSLTPLLHIPYDPKLLIELNTPSYLLTKTGKLQFTHPDGTLDDRFWAIAMAVNSTVKTKPSKPVAIH